MGNYVKREDLNLLKRSIERESDLLVTLINSFNSTAGEIDIILEKLKIYYNTSAGNLKNNKIANINFHSEKLSRFSKAVDKISINYYLKD